MRGYLVDLMWVSNPNDISGVRKKILMTSEVLSKLLLEPSKCDIISATLVDIKKYQAKHIEIEFWG